MLTLKRFGITTGAAAAAAAKAAALCLEGTTPATVTIPTPIGLRLEIPVERVYREGDRCCGEVRKFAGDNPDVLNGVVVKVCVEPRGGGLEINCGRGVGIVTKPGLPVPPGECAINPVPRQMIAEALREAGFNEGLVVVEVPGGEELAKFTKNAELGIVGGISILGTTGLEFPVSDADYLGHIEAELKTVRAGSDVVVLATGNRAVEYARREFGDIVVKVGDWVGAAAELAARLDFKAIVIAGLPAKIAKIAAGALNTHSSYCDARVETLVYAALKAGIPYDLVSKLIDVTSVAEALHVLGPYSGEVLTVVARRAKERLSRHVGREVMVVIYDEEGRRVGVA